MLSAAILAGGQARRFGGCDKGALLVEGRPIRERQIAELASITSDILVVGRGGGGSTHEARGDPAARTRFVADRVPGCGPLGGLHTALLESLGDRTIVIACDMPYITAPLAAYLATLAAEADIVVPRTDRGYHPLCAAYARGCLEPVARRIADGRLKMIDLFEDVRVRVVTVEELSAFGDVDRLLANVNSPAEYREFTVRSHQS
jgi:molybdopterin-guanine dinucleotide biosynthesis protein A